MNILVSGASGIVGYGILRSLKKYHAKLNLIGASIYEDSVAQGFCDIFELAPPTNNTTYIEWLLAIIKKHHIDLIIPGIEIDMYTWVEHIPEIEAHGAIPLLNNAKLIKLCKDKWEFYKALSNSRVNYIINSTLNTEFDTLTNTFGLPFLLKPRRGFASQGIVRIDNIDTFLKHQKYIGQSLLVQPIVGNDNEEYTTSAFCDGRGGFNACMTLKRKLSKDGFTEKANVVSSDEFTEIISDLCNNFHPIGPTNFQFRKCDDGIKLLEINPRISSSTSIRAAFGYNESIMAVDYFLHNITPTQPTISRGKAVRYTDEYIFYENSVHL